MLRIVWTNPLDYWWNIWKYMALCRISCLAWLTWNRQTKFIAQLIYGFSDIICNIFNLHSIISWCMGAQTQTPMCRITWIVVPYTCTIGSYCNLLLFYFLGFRWWTVTDKPSHCGWWIWSGQEDDFVVISREPATNICKHHNNNYI